MARLKAKDSPQPQSDVKKTANYKKKTALLKYRRLFDRLMENGGKMPDGKRVTMQRAMIAEGYSPAYAKSGSLVKTDAWQELLDEAVPDSLITKKLGSLLEAKEIKTLLFFHKISDAKMREVIENEGFRFVGIQRFMTRAVVTFIAPNPLAQNITLEKILKLKKKYGAITIKHRFGELSDEELEGEASREISEALGFAEGEEEAGN